ncbi:MAG: alpha-L-rhamnosidase C-terminal domain-containing protein [Gemmatimonadota bacterium]
MSRLVYACAVFAILARLPVAAPDLVWNAQWVGAAGTMRPDRPDVSRPNLWLAFRKEVVLDAAPASASARIAADSKYWLWINGRLVVFEGQLKRGPTPEDIYYDTVDLTPYLEAGTNTVAVLVWHWGRSALSHRDSGRAGLLFDATIDGEPLLSDRTWKVIEHPAYDYTDEPHPNSALPEPNVRFDAREDIAGWEARGYDDSGWADATEFGRPPVAPWNAPHPRPIPLWRDSGLREFENASDFPAVSTGRPIVGRLPYDAQVTPYLKVDAPAGTKIDIRTDSYHASGRPSVRAVYLTRDGVQEYESLGWMSGHEVQYRIPAGVRILELKYRETGYDAEFVGRFESDDDAVNTLWRKARRTLYVNMRDSHMDSPDRERAQYWGDVVNELGQALYALDADRGPLLARKGMYELVRWSRGDTLTSPIPSGTRTDSPEMPLQMLAAVGWYGFWTYYRYTGDSATIRDVYPAVRDYLDLWRLDTDGLVLHRTGDWDWADWGAHADVPVLENAWYYLALKAAAAMAEVAGEEADIAAYERRMTTVASAFDRTFWQGDRYRSPTHEGATDDRANAMAVVAGLARPEYHSAIRRVLAREEHASPYMEKYVIEALFMMDASAHAIDRMKRRWAAQIASPLTTLWELWDWDPNRNSYNHGWAGGGLTLLSQYAAGVAPVEPGYETYSVLPRMGQLRRIDAAVPTPRGSIRLRLDRADGFFGVDLTSPAGTDATVGVPTDRVDVRRITVNGRDIWHEGRPVSTDSEVRFLGTDDGRLMLRVPPGRWSIHATGERKPVLPPSEAFNLTENPIRSDEVTFNFREPPDMVTVYTVTGRRVVDLHRRVRENERIIRWDLTNGRGTRVAPGVYLLVARVGDELVRRKLFIVRGREE